MKREDWKNLPVEVKDFVWDNIDNFSDEIIKKFSLTEEQLYYILDLCDEIFLKKISPLDLPQELERMEGSDDKDLRAIALDISYNILWPLQEYLDTVDRLILRLGGKVPKLKHLRKAPMQKKVVPGEIDGSVKQLMSEYDNFKELRLSSNKIIDKRGKKVSPTVENWINDYVHFLGAGYHNSLERIKYESKNSNFLETSSEEKETLRLFFTSYDDNTIVHFDNSDNILIIEEKKEKEEESVEDINVKDILDKLHKELLDIEKEIFPSDFILSEGNNDIHKVRDILWNAIGVQDSNKVVSCIKVLLEKKALDLMLHDDSRFKSIVKRYVGLHYGNNVENYLDINSDKLLARRIFLEIVLVDKLKIEERKGILFAFYLSNLISKSGQVVYLDEDDGKLYWRLLQVNGNQLAWSNNI